MLLLWLRTSTHRLKFKDLTLNLVISHFSLTCFCSFFFPHLLFSQSFLYSWVFQRSRAFSNCSFCLESPSLSSCHPSLLAKFLSIQKHSAQAVLRAFNRGTTSAGGSTLAYLQESIPCIKWSVHVCFRIRQATLSVFPSKARDQPSFICFCYPNEY